MAARTQERSLNLASAVENAVKVKGVISPKDELLYVLYRQDLERKKRALAARKRDLENKVFLGNAQMSDRHRWTLSHETRFKNQQAELKKVTAQLASVNANLDLSIVDVVAVYNEKSGLLDDQLVWKNWKLHRDLQDTAELLLQESRLLGEGLNEDIYKQHSVRLSRDFARIIDKEAGDERDVTFEGLRTDAAARAGELVMQTVNFGIIHEHDFEDVVPEAALTKFRLVFRLFEEAADDYERHMVTIKGTNFLRVDGSPFGVNDLYIKFEDFLKHRYFAAAEIEGSADHDQLTRRHLISLIHICRAVDTTTYVILGKNPQLDMDTVHGMHSELSTILFLNIYSNLYNSSGSQLESGVRNPIQSFVPVPRLLAGETPSMVDNPSDVTRASTLYRVFGDPNQEAILGLYPELHRDEKSPDSAESRVWQVRKSTTEVAEVLQILKMGPARWQILKDFPQFIQLTEKNPQLLDLEPQLLQYLVKHDMLARFVSAAPGFALGAIRLMSRFVSEDTSEMGEEALTEWRAEVVNRVADLHVQLLFAAMRFSMDHSHLEILGFEDGQVKLSENASADDIRDAHTLINLARLIQESIDLSVVTANELLPADAAMDRDEIEAFALRKYSFRGWFGKQKPLERRLSLHQDVSDEKMNVEAASEAIQESERRYASDRSFFTQSQSPLAETA